MHEMVANMALLETVVGHGLRLVGTAIDVFGVLLIVLGIAWSTAQFVRRHADVEDYVALRTRLGRSLLLGLEVLVAADIVKTIALDLTFTSVGVLAALILARTFLSWTLVLEIEGRWPWRRGE